jgi:2-keto-4-pentenoate hydratase
MRVAVRVFGQREGRDVLDENDRNAAGELLWRMWQSGEVIDGLPGGLRPDSREDGYAVQATLDARTGKPPFGWKIAATSKAGQAHIGVDGPLAGRLLAERVFQNGAGLVLGASRMKVAEPEFAFRMRRDLSPRADDYTVDEVLDAVGSLHPSIEVPNSRYADFVTVGAPQLIADNGCAHEFVFGPRASDRWRDVDLAAHEVEASVVGRYDRSGGGFNVLDDPRLALTWLANELSGIGETLRAGQVVTTGTCVVPLEIEPGDTVRADFGMLGVVEMRFRRE